MMNFTPLHPGVPGGASGSRPGAALVCPAELPAVAQVRLARRATNETSGARRPVARLDVRVIGIGGAGCSSLCRLNEFLPGDARFLGIETGSGAAGLRAFADVIQMGQGFGSGGDPAVAEGLFTGPARSGGSGGYLAEVSGFVAGADVVVIVAGLGRGTGSGIAPLVARLSKESGALTLAAVTMPFEFEGRFRSASAAQALNRLQDSSDSVFVIRNDDLLNSVRTTGSASLVEAFKEADSKITNTVLAVISVLQAPESTFAEVEGFLRNSGKTVVLSGSSHGLHAGKTAVEQAFASMSPGVFGASGLAEVNCALIHVEGGIGLSTGQVAEAAAAIRARTGHLAESHVSSVREVAMGRRIRVTLVLAARGPTAELKPGPTLKKMARSTSDRNSIWPNGLQKPATVSEDLEIQRPVRRRGPMLLPVS